MSSTGGRCTLHPILRQQQNKTKLSITMFTAPLPIRPVLIACLCMLITGKDDSTTSSGHWCVVLQAVIPAVAECVLSFWFCIAVDAEATVPCSLTTSSPFFGAKVRSSSSAYVDQVPTWLKYGPLRALSLSYSTVSGCLLGVSATYGKTSVFSQGLGLFGNRQAGDVFQQLPLAQGERVTHIEIQSSTK